MAIPKQPGGLEIQPARKRIRLVLPFFSLVIPLRLATRIPPSSLPVNA